MICGLQMRGLEAGTFRFLTRGLSSEVGVKVENLWKVARKTKAQNWGKTTISDSAQWPLYCGAEERFQYLL